jgi:hypothetical protein
VYDNWAFTELRPRNWRYLDGYARFCWSLRALAAATTCIPPSWTHRGALIDDTDSARIDVNLDKAHNKMSVEINPLK